MSFEHKVMTFAERFLSERTFRLVVAPAIADLQFEQSAATVQLSANRVAVLKAVAGGLRDDVARASSGMLGLALLPAGYYIFLLVICFDVYSISISTNFFVVAALILLLSFAPVMACFWPERPNVRPVD